MRSLLPRAWLSIPTFSLIVALHAAADITGPVVIFESMPVPIVSAHADAVYAHILRQRDFGGPRNEIIHLQADGDFARGRVQLQTVIDSQTPALVITVATLATQVAMEVLADTDIPVVFCVVSDPVGAGIVESVGVPASRLLTGRVYSVPREASLDTVTRLLGVDVEHPIRIGIIHSSYPSSLSDVNVLTKAAEQRDFVRFLPYEIPYREVPAGLPAMLSETALAIELLEPEVDVWWHAVGPLGESPEFVKVFHSVSAHPVVYGVNMRSVADGALCTLAADPVATGNEIAAIAESILEGVDPRTFAVEPASSFSFGVNVSTAVSLGIVIPPDMLASAGEHVYR